MGGERIFRIDLHQLRPDPLGVVDVAQMAERRRENGAGEIRVRHQDDPLPQQSGRGFVFFRQQISKPEEVQEGTFSITNPGIYGGLMGLPVINQPNVAILGIGAIQKRPMVIEDAIAVRSMVYLTLSYDHRIVDGAIAHQFVGKVKAYLEGWSEEIL